MRYIDFATRLHTKTKRNYVERVLNDKAACATVARQFGRDYWDGDRKYGYGGMRYDGRWRPIADDIARHYELKSGDKILDVGCGKGYLLYEFTQSVPGVQVAGIDVSAYGVENAKPEIKPFLRVGNAVKLPFEDKSFDFVISITTLHNLYNFELWEALREIERVGKDKKYIVVESYRNEEEKVNLLNWQLTCESFYTPQEWEWFLRQAGYSGDYGCIYFE
jgi:SAM-dependent methyltransferase